MAAWTLCRSSYSGRSLCSRCALRCRVSICSISCTWPVNDARYATHTQGLARSRKGSETQYKVLSTWRPSGHMGTESSIAAAEICLGHGVGLGLQARLSCALYHLERSTL